MRFFAILILTLAASLQATRADERLSVPDRHVTFSKSRRIQVVADPKDGTKCIDMRDKKDIWSLPQWFRKLVISDDGHHMVTEYDGLNLIPQDYDGKMIMITFWNDGKKIREVTLDELIPNKKILSKSAYHYAWGSLAGFRQDGTVEIRLVDDTRLIYDSKTGRKVEKAGTGEPATRSQSKSEGSDKP